MRRTLLSLSILAAIFGCEVNKHYAILPDSPLTPEQQLAVAREDAAACNCGRSVEVDIRALMSELFQFEFDFDIR